MKENRTSTLSIRLTASEKEHISAKAKEARVSLTDYVLALSNNKKIYVVEGIEDFVQYFALATAEMNKLKNQIIRVGVNLNEITLIANTLKEVSNSELSYANAQVEKIRELATKAVSIEHQLVEIVGDMTEQITNRVDGKFPKV